MNVDTARRIDYCAGVPLCFLGTVIKKLVSLFGAPEPGLRPRRILLLGLSEMGSVILAGPAIRKLRAALDAEVFFAIFSRNSPSLALLDTVPPVNIFRMRDSGMTALAADFIRFFFWTRKNRIDTVIDLELFSRFTALLAGFSGAARTVGFHAFHGEGLYRGDFLTHKVAYNPHQHIAKNFIAQVNALLSDSDEVPYSKTFVPDDELAPQKAPVREQSKTAMQEKLRSAFPVYDPARHRVVLFNTDSSDLVPLRRWPKEYFVRLARMILGSYGDVVILLTGDASEREGKGGIIRAVDDERCVNFAGLTEIAELPALYSMSRLMLTNDSGPAHFASVTDMPVYVFFGPETPKLYGPLGAAVPIYAGLACSPCVTAANHRKSPCRDNVCLQVITPEQVFSLLQPRLDGGRPAS